MKGVKAARLDLSGKELAGIWKKEDGGVKTIAGLL